MGMPSSPSVHRVEKLWLCALSLMYSSLDICRIVLATGAIDLLHTPSDMQVGEVGKAPTLSGPMHKAWKGSALMIQ